ncbi:PhzF family phenazine biosynthesis protein [Maribellus sp. YY47]|uniref:PhzF family phenazine biosynthesis protein n=1 Tax=Maribellus sp. YY47 TaxID=2929486 RepID=UPI002000D8A4|nr:PhzF family phenazine biosynthesis protein [Maribellus sp. YY47]
MYAIKSETSTSIPGLTKLPLFQVDAFADQVFSGNPAAVVPLKTWLPDDILQKIALENNLSETAFFCENNDGFKIRWFTPLAEVDLCGHATLASAHVLCNHLGYDKKEIVFESRSGILRVNSSDNMILLDFPASPIDEITMPAALKGAFNIHPKSCVKGRNDLMLIFEDESEVLRLQPDFEWLVKAQTRGIICTSLSEKFDFVSRFFAPSVGINEDPVTGSAHTMLIPYWSKQLGKAEMVAKQVSKRGGILYCRHLNERVEIGGKAITYLQGEITIQL